MPTSSLMMPMRFGVLGEQGGGTAQHFGLEDKVSLHCRDLLLSRLLPFGACRLLGAEPSHSLLETSCTGAYLQCEYATGFGGNGVGCT